MNQEPFKDPGNSTEGIGEPVFQHDCSSCKFLGHYKERDLYFCGYNGSSKDVKAHHPTVISRFGSEGSKYSSGLLFKYREGHLLEAIHRSIKRGFMTQEFYDEAISHVNW